MILVTGGAGFIGSHVCVELISSGYDVAVLDSLVNSERGVIDCVEKITGVKIPFYKADVRNFGALDRIFTENDIEAVLHFAGLKSVPESAEFPLEYYDCNVVGTLKLCEAMQKHGVNRLIFSSSATVYGADNIPPYKEDMMRGKTANPYAETKAVIERMLEDEAAADSSFNVTVLRYFNPVGAYESGLIGENPRGVPGNLFPYLSQVAAGQRPYLNVYGDDYDTPDGTGMRDYIHVCDLAEGHVAALKNGNKTENFSVYNLGTSKPYSVFDILRAYEKACGKTIEYKVMPRRKGDIALMIADASKAETQLGFKAKRTLEDMCRDSWNYVCKNKVR